ncbi:MAG: MerR family transcriptional regulator, light-induced transcriptional regulator [Solirubrobacteraceae bacterium]|nr:MerR family transcriptional regulator, light-induced transcriptional regulator [Solirubrobacteraceae bacterium]
MRTNAAAAMLGVSPSTLRSWERRFGYPEPRRSPGGHRQFDLGEIEALRAAFQETQNVSSAIALARDRGEGPATPARLRSALGRFDETEADRVLEESLAVRSVERTVEEVLLPGVAALDGGSAEQAFAWRWATGWLAAAKRVAPAASRDDAVVVFDSSAPGDMDALYAQALELALRRRGLRTLTLAATLDAARLARALHAVGPRAVVLTGCHASLDALARLVYTARRERGDGVAVFDFRGALPETGASTVERLGARPLAASERIVDVIEGRAGERRQTLRAVNG